MTFSLFYLFDWKFRDLIFFFSFLHGKTCALEKSGAPQRFCAPECAGLASQNLSKPTWVNLLGTSALFQYFLGVKVGCILESFFPHVLKLTLTTEIWRNFYQKICFYNNKNGNTEKRDWFMLLFEGREEVVNTLFCSKLYSHW